MRAEHFSKDTHYRKPFGAVRKGTSVLLRFRFCAENDSPDIGPEECDCRLMLRREAVKDKEYFEISPRSLRQCGEGIYEAEYVIESGILSEPGVYFYSAECGSADTARDEYQITVYDEGLSVPEWFLNAVIYQIFPDRFYRAEDDRVQYKENSFLYASWDDKPYYIKNSAGEIERWEFFGGNLKGVSEKLDYVSYLGADTIYLNPVFEARSNHRYDTADYMRIDGMLGGYGAFREMSDTAKSKNIRIILDGVFNHTGRHSIYFTEKKEWYTFKEDGTYDCWWGVEDLPAVNKKSEDFMDFIARSDSSVIKKWTAEGVSGWRLDVADELSDTFIKEIRKAAESARRDSVIIGEVWEDASNKISYGERKMYFTDRELHTHTNYLFRNAVVSFLEGSASSRQASRVFEDIRENYPTQNFFAQVNMTGSHDVERLMSVMLRIAKGDRRLARDLVKCFTLIQFTSPGVPLIYYGDETCMEGGTDPDNRRTYPWGHEDRDMIEWFSSLAHLRRGEHGLVKGDVYYPDCGDDNIFALVRTPYNEGAPYYITVCDRFCRGKEIIEKNINKIVSGIENFHKKSYIITKNAGDYAALAILK